MRSTQALLLFSFQKLKVNQGLISDKYVVREEGGIVVRLGVTKAVEMDADTGFFLFH